MAYSDKVIDHYNNPRNVGSLPKEDPNVGTGLVGAPECGDVMKLQIKVNEESGVIEDAKFKTFGCGSAIASSSLATEWVKGKSLAEALAIKNTDIVKELSLPPVKIHCSVLADDAIKAAVTDWKRRGGCADSWRAGGADGVVRPEQPFAELTTWARRLLLKLSRHPSSAKRGMRHTDRTTNKQWQLKSQRKPTKKFGG